MSTDPLRTPAEDPPSRSNRRVVTAALMLVMVLSAMELNITSTAMPTIIGDLHGLEHYSWVTSLYLLLCTVSMPVYGRLADTLGRKRIVLWAIAIFGIASVLAASAQTLGQLILFRGLQGLGAGGIMPVVLTILGDIFTLEERAAVQGWFSAVWGGSALAGPAVGALLVGTLGWRSIFFINLPFGAIGFAALAWKYRDRESADSTELDLPGAALLTIACAAILTLVSGLGPDGWPWPAAIALLLTAIVAAAWFLRVERRAANPILPPALLKDRVIGSCWIGSALMGVCFFSVDTYVPLYVQGTTGAGAAAAAAVVTPVMLSWALSGIIAAPLVVRAGFRRVAFLGCGLTSLSFLALVLCAVERVSGALLTAVLTVSGVGFGAASLPYLLCAQHGVAWQQRGAVTSGIQFFRTLGGAIGIGLLGMLFNVLSAPQMQRIREMGVNPAAVMDPRTRSELPQRALDVASGMIGSGMVWVFAAMLACALVQWAATLLMPPPEVKRKQRGDSLAASAPLQPAGASSPASAAAEPR